MVMGMGIKVALAALLLSMQGRPVQTHHLLLSKDVVQELNSIADTATIEHLRCVTGRNVGDTTYVEGIFVPRTSGATPVSINGFCPAQTVVDWHNHLPYWYTTTGEKRGPVEPRSLACYPSYADANTWLHGYADWAMISVDRNTWCLFVRVRDSKLPPRIMRVNLAPPDGTSVKP